MNKKEELQDKIKIQKYLVDLYTVQLNEAEIDLGKAQKELEVLEKRNFEPTPKGWKPKPGEKYWIAHYNLNPTIFICDERAISKNILKYNRIFKTEGECELYCDIQRAFRDASREFVGDKYNYYIYYNQSLNELRIASYSNNVYQALCFDSRETVQNIINKFGEENIKRYYLGVY